MDEQLQPVTDVNAPNVKDLFFRYVRFLPLFIISVALSLFVAYIYLRYATPVYRSSGVLVIEQEDQQFQGDEKFQKLFSSNNSKNILSEIEYLRSRRLIERVVRSLNLNATYYAVGNIKEQNIYKSCPITLQAVQPTDSLPGFTLNIEFQDDNTFQINGEKKSYAIGETFQIGHGVFKLLRTSPGSISKQYKITWQPTSSAASMYISNLLIAPKAQGTGLLNIIQETTNPVLAADVVNQLMKEYQQATVEDKNVTTKQTLFFINDRLRKISEELDSVTRGLLAFQKANNVIDVEAQSTNYFSGADETDKQIAQGKVQLEMTQYVEGYLRDRKNNFNTTPSALGLVDPTLSTLITGYNTLQLERKALIDGAVPRTNVRVQQLEDQIEKLRQSLLENLRNIKATQQGALNDLQHKSGDIQAQIRSLPEKQQNLIDIKRQQESKLAIYNFLQEKREETNISLAATISDTKVLEEAMPNNYPVKPSSRNIQLLAVVIGLVLPALFIFILEISNDKINGRADVEKLTRTIIIGEVGHSYKKEVLVVTPNNRSVVAEQFRIIRSNLQYVLNKIEKPVLLVTSSFSGEGKSFISVNIGSVMALAGKRTIILEFDIRKPKVLSELGIPKKPGFINYLLGKVSLEELPIPVEGQENLFVLACGPVPPNPAELLLDEKLADVFTYLRNNFDVVIIDTAPVGIVSDAMSIGKYANATLYIVRQGYTFKKQMNWIEEFQQLNKLPKISIVMNDVRQRLGYGSYGYGQYGYSYSYSSAYFEEVEEPPTLFSTWFGWLNPKNWGKKKRKR